MLWHIQGRQERLPDLILGLRRHSRRKDGQKDAWIFIPKGSCEKIVGAALKPGK